MTNDYGSVVLQPSTGFIYVGEVKIGRIVRMPDGSRVFQACDKDRRRSSKRGTRLPEVPVERLAEVLTKEP